MATVHSYADVTATSPATAGQGATAESHPSTSTLTQQAPLRRGEGSIGAKLFEAGPSTRTVEINPSLRPNSTQLPGAWALILDGRGAAGTPPNTLAPILLENKLIPSLEKWNRAAYYRLGSPFERFVQFETREDHRLRHGGFL